MPLPLLPFVAGAVMLGTAVAYLTSGGEKAPAKGRTPTTRNHSAPPKVAPALKANFARLRDALKTSERPRIAFLGGPGIGKSTLIVTLSGDSVRPRPLIGAETDATDWSQKRDVAISAVWEGLGAAGVMVVDFPGFGTQRHPHSYFVSAVPLELFEGVVFLVGGKLRKADEDVFATLRRKAGDDRIIVARTRTDAVPDESRDEIAADIAARLHWPGPVVLTSSRTGEGLAPLKERVASWTSDYAQRR